jgi:hypothetical protein
VQSEVKMLESWLPERRCPVAASVATGTSATSGSAGSSPRRAAQRARDEAEEHVVQGDAEGAAYDADVVQGERRRDEGPPRGERSVERGARRVQDRQRRRHAHGASPLGDCDQVSRRPSDERREPACLAHVVGHGVAQQPAARRQRLGRPRGVGRLAREVAQPGSHDVREESRHRDAVGDRVVDLPHGGHPPACEPVEEPELPERPPPVERHAREEPDDLVHLARAARRRDGRAADVVVEVERRIFDPERMVEAERNLHEPPPERRQEVHARAEVRLHALDRVVDAGRGAEHRDLDRVHVERRRLHVEEARVDACESLHSQPPPPPSANGSSRRSRARIG